MCFVVFVRPSFMGSRDRCLDVQHINMKRNVVLSLSIAGILLVPAMLFFSHARAQDTGVPTAEGQIAAALEDLSGVYGEPVTRIDQARAICNLDEYIADCAEIGTRHDLFAPEEKAQVESILEELKGQFTEDLKQCTDESCLVDVANRLARRLQRKDPDLAEELDLTLEKVEEKRVIVETAKEVGVDVEACRTMDPDTAPVELLRACARLAKDKRLEGYISEEARRRANETDTVLLLQESLARGEYQCGDNTSNGCGNFCLNPLSGTRSADASAIPQVCREIAERFFGPEGIEHLEAANTEVANTAEYYRSRARNAVFTTIDGRTLNNPVDIGRYMEEEMKSGNVEAIEKGMDFMTSRGFVRPEDRAFAIRMVQQVRDQGGDFDLNLCEQNPASCSEFIPDDHREEFSVMENIYRIMNEEMRSRGVPDPSLCESSPQYGASCVKAAEAALSKIQEIAKEFPQAQFIVADIQRKISFGNSGLEARGRVEEEFRRSGGELTIGDQNFRTFEDVDVFCRKNGTLCLTDAAKQGFIEKDYAAEKYEYTYEVHYGPSYEERSQIPGPDAYRGQGPYPGFVPPGAGGYPPGQVAGFTAAGPGFGPPPGFNKEEALKRFQEWLDNPQGAPPVPAFGVAPSYPQQQGGPYPSGPFQGQFPQAPVSGQQYPSYTPSFCAFSSPPSICPDGQYRQESRDQRGCVQWSECIPVSQTEVPCPALYSVGSCPAGQHKVVTYNSPQCGTYYGCEQDGQGGGEQCQPGQYWNGYICVASESPSCPVGQYWFVPPQGGPGYCKGASPIAVPSFPDGCVELESLIPGCHLMPESPSARFNGGMTQYVFLGTRTVKSCASDSIPGCTSSGTPGGSCTQDLVALLGNGCHSMGNAFFDSGMTRYVLPGSSAVGECGASYIQNCTIGTIPPGGSPACSDGRDNDGDGKIDFPLDTGCYNAGDWDETSGGYAGGCRSYYDQNSCQSASCVWYPNHYDGTHCDDAAHGQSGGGGGGTTGCDAALTQLLGTGCHQMYTDSSGNRIFCDGPMTKSAKWGDTAATPGCTSPGGSGGVPSCSDGRDNDGDGQTDYPADTGCTNRDDWDEAAGGTVGSKPQCSDGQDNDNDGKTDYPGDTSCYGNDDNDEWYPTSGGTGTTGAQCSDGRDNDSDGLVDYPSDTGCYSASDPDEAYTGGTTPPPSSGTCPSFAHDMGGYCMLNNDTSRCAEYPSAATEGNYTSATCQQRSGTTGATTCPSGQYWSGSACVTSTSQSCPSGQYWNGTACVNTSQCPSGQYWNGSACVTTTSTDCPFGQYWNGTACASSTSSSCPSGQWWNGTTCQSVYPSCASGQTWDSVSGACVTSGTTPPPSSSTTCPPDQYWNGSACVTSSYTSCPSGQYWDGTSCVTSTTPPPSSSTTCPSDQYWNGSACVSSTPPPPTPPPPPPSPPPSAFLFSPKRCPAKHRWNGHYCVVRPQSGAHVVAEIRTSFRELGAVFSALVNW